MAGLTAIKRKGFRGGGMDMSTVSAKDIGIGTSTSKREYSPKEKKEQRETKELNERINRNREIREDIKKRKLEKSIYDVGPKKNVFEKFGDFKRKHNLKKRRAYINRILSQNQKKISAGLFDIENIPGVDLMNTSDYISFAPDITAFGPPTEENNFTGTGKYSQEFIDDVLSGKRAPPEFFSEINVAGVPTLAGKGLAIGANFLGKTMSGPVTKQALDALNKQKTGIMNLDPNTMSTKEMMEIYEPNRYDMIYGDKGNGDGKNQPYLPINYSTSASLPEVDERETQTFEFDPSRFGGGAEAADVTRASYIFNQGGRVPRQGYFLGGVIDTVGDVIGGVADAAGKVLKSDLGKAAIAGAAYYYGGGGGMPKFLGGKGLGGAKLFGEGSFFSKANPLLFSEGAFNPLKMAGLITLGGAAMGPAKQDSLEGFNNRGGRLIDPLTGKEATPAEMRASIDSAVEEAAGDPVKLAAIDQKYNNMLNLGLPDNLPYPNYALFASGGRVPAQEGGLMDLGGMEKDYRAEGGFVPIGKAEKADDVPARLSVNEFVFTADAVRNAGGGDIDKGAEVMENMMKNLENGGRVSEESQGNAGAQEMFSVSERIGEVI